MFLSEDRKYMDLAVLEMKKCPDVPHKPKVGCVIVLNGEVISSGYRGQGEANRHAERVALDALEASLVKAVGATIYSTMEPCIGTNAECSERIVNSGIKVVVFGSFDINPTIKGRGYEFLKSKGLTLRGFDSDIHLEVDDLNSEFIDNFQKSTGPRNHCSFPYEQNQNKSRLELIFSENDNRSIAMRCSSRDETSVYLYADPPVVVARTKELCEFDDLDNSLLALYDFDYFTEINSNEIAVFKCKDGFALVKVSKIDRNVPVVHVKFEIRPFNGHFA